MTIEELINYLNDNVISDVRFDPYIKEQLIRFKYMFIYNLLNNLLKISLINLKTSEN